MAVQELFKWTQHTDKFHPAKPEEAKCWFRIHFKNLYQIYYSPHYNRAPNGNRKHKPRIDVYRPTKCRVQVSGESSYYMMCANEEAPKLSCHASQPPSPNLRICRESPNCITAQVDENRDGSVSDRRPGDNIDVAITSFDWCSV